jgi:hypothetical protein
METTVRKYTRKTKQPVAQTQPDSVETMESTEVITPVKKTRTKKIKPKIEEVILVPETMEVEIPVEEAPSIELKDLPDEEKIVEIINHKIDKIQKSMSVELTTDQVDELIFRLTRANLEFNIYMHKSLQLDANHNINEETESRMIIIKDYNTFKTLNLILNDTISIVLEHGIEEICIYENIIEFEQPNHFTKYFNSIKRYFSDLKFKLWPNKLKMEENL